jgi:uncharacterized protein (DUF1684 family)
MFRKVLLSLFIALPLIVNAQSYADGLLAWRQEYTESLLQGNHPLKPDDTSYLRFYAPDPKYKVQGEFVKSSVINPFLLGVKHGGTNKAVRYYGNVYLNMDGATMTLYIFQFMGHENDSDYDKLFIPFRDRTNYKETFEGGRYIDLLVSDIKDNRVVIDFNKSYNPHTAYEKGYPYIIPPPANNLLIEIRAGEKIFGHDPGY